ncbi:MAG: class I SAM-dependent DNA methyltransferase [Xanthobacteraceae bacterium]|nr:class I SAM-dependent DNA methyltransferase [Xanthobacteraceae bacterium]
MTPEQFIEKWSRLDRNERQAAQEHFIDLCRLLGEPTPNEGDVDSYTFEKGASKIDGSPGFADVWKRGHFGWEYKKDKANLDRAYQQLQLYSVALENPPLLVVSDTKRFRIYTNWTNTVQKVHEFTLDDLRSVDTRELLQWAFRNPGKLKPAKTREQVTREAADKFSTIALRLQGHAPEKIAHFLNRLVFCLFADDVNLFSDDLFSRVLDNLAKRRERVPEESKRILSELFRNMQKGGAFGLENILHFNGGLFDDDEALPLDADSLDILREIAKQDWSAIDPTIFGTLFERFLDPDKRAQIGAHYTDREKIMMIVEPVIVRPLLAEWEAAKAELTEILSKNRNRDGAPGRASLARAEVRLDEFMKRLDGVRVLDPACGSGNFLYLALQSLKDIERRAIVEAMELGMSYRPSVQTGPHNVKGIEINQYAAELARTSIWIGNLQWLRRNGFEVRKEPVLEPLEAIECRDALVTKRADGTYEEAKWPEAEFIVGNPPFLGIRMMRAGLGDETVETLFDVYRDRVSREADLVIYWFEKARAAIREKKTSRAGFVSTNSIRGGSNRRVLDQISEETKIFEAWGDEPWVVEGAAVRVSMICFGNHNSELHLNGQIVPRINSNLTSGAADVTKIKRLAENVGMSFMGDTKGGAFDIDGELARDFLKMPLNPNGRPNSDVVRPWPNGLDITGRPRDKWIVTFGWEMSERDASLYEAPFAYIKEHVFPERSQNRREAYRLRWWRHVEPRPGMWRSLARLSRFIVTPETPTYTVFAWLPISVLPDKNLTIIARDDYSTFGLLQSKFHIQWTRAIGSPYGNHPFAIRYNSTRIFQTFPFPEGLTPNIPAKDYEKDPRAVAIAKAAKRLDELRNAWLNPPDLVEIVPEVVPGYPDRILPKNEKAAAELKKRTLTNLYNARPQWLDDAHRDLDSAVAAAYGWPADISEEDALAKLLELNLSRAGAGDEAEIEDEDDDGEESGTKQLFADAQRPKKKPRKR